MEINFNSDKKGKMKSEVKRGDYEGMLKERAKMLPKIQAEIQEALADYDGRSFALLIIKEDENGMPSGVHALAAGVSRPANQLYLSKALNNMAEELLDHILETAKGDVDAMLQVATEMLGIMKADNKEDK